MDNPIRVTIDSPRFASPDLKIRVAALLEKALLEDLAKVPANIRQGMSQVNIVLENEDHQPMLESTTQILGNPDIIDVRPLQVEIIVR